MIPSRKVSRRVYIAVNRIAARVTREAGGTIARRSDGNYAVRPKTAETFISLAYTANLGTDSERTHYSAARNLNPETFSPAAIRAEWKAYRKEIAETEAASTFAHCAAVRPARPATATGAHEQPEALQKENAR